MGRTGVNSGFEREELQFSNSNVLRGMPARDLENETEVRIAMLSHLHFPIREPFAGGLEMHTHLVCRELAKAGHDVTLFGREGSTVPGVNAVPILKSGPWVSYEDPASLPARRQIESVEAAYRKACSVIDRGAFDVVFNNTLNKVPLEWANELPMFTMFHTPIIHEIKHAVRASSGLSSRKFASVSRVNLPEWTTYAPQATVIHNGIDVTAWKFSPTSGDGLRWSARITPEKGLHLAIEAARIAGEQLRIVGPISNRDYFDRAIRPHLSSRISYEGHLKHHELSGFLGSGSATLATPLWEEPFGLTMVESLACGTPVVALPRGAVKEVISKRCGTVVRDCTAEAMAEAIPRTRAKDRFACRKHVEEGFSADRMIRDYSRVLTRLVRGDQALVTRPTGTAY